MKRFVCIFIVSFFLSACQSEKLPAVKKGAVVLILGDSLSFGSGAKESENYPILLAAKTNWNIVNAGVPGNTSEQGLSRLASLIKNHQPKLLIIELGGNDFLRNVIITKTVANLKACIQQAQQQNIQVVLMAIPAFSPIKAAFTGLSDHKIYEEIAQEMNVPLIEDVFSGVLSDNALKSNAIHPNAAGYREVTALLQVALTNLGLLQTQ